MVYNPARRSYSVPDPRLPSVWTTFYDHRDISARFDGRRVWIAADELCERLRVPLGYRPEYTQLVERLAPIHEAIARALPDSTVGPG